MLKFLNKFADDFGLVGLIRFGAEVVRVEKEDEVWVVEAEFSSGLRLVELFEAVVVCTGHYTRPKLADIPGEHSLGLFGDACIWVFITH